MNSTVRIQGSPVKILQCARTFFSISGFLQVLSLKQDCLR